jgi:hypothetical protein
MRSRLKTTIERKAGRRDKSKEALENQDNPTLSQQSSSSMPVDHSKRCRFCVTSLDHHRSDRNSCPVMVAFGTQLTAANYIQHLQKV